MSIQCQDLKGDRAMGAYWEDQFCIMAGACGKSMTPHQIKRTGSAIAGKLSGQTWSTYTLPDVTLWTHPGEHHEIKHKNPTKYGGIGLEDYRLQALLWFTRETKQSVHYTLHLHNLNGGRDNKRNDNRHWYTINVLEMEAMCSSGEAYRSDRMQTYLGGKPAVVTGWYWPVVKFKPLMFHWYPSIASLMPPKFSPGDFLPAADATITA